MSPRSCLERARLLKGVVAVVLAEALVVLLCAGVEELQVLLGQLKETAWALVLRSCYVTLLTLKVYQSVLSHPASPKVPL